MFEALLDPSPVLRLVARLDELEPGPELGGVIEEAALAALMTDAPVLRAAVAAAADRQIAYLEGVRLGAVAGLVESFGEDFVPVGEQVVVGMSAIRQAAGEVGAGSVMSPSAAQSLVDLAQRMAERPRAAAALEAGRIDLPRARVIALEVTGIGTTLTPEQLDGIEERAVEYAVGHTVPALRDRIRKWLAAADPASAEERHKDAVAARRVSVQSEPNGMASLVWFDTAPRIQAAKLRIAGLAQKAEADGEAEPDGRAIGAVRADVLNDLVNGAEPGAAAAVELVVHIPFDSLAGELEGVGWIGAEQTRQLAAAARSVQLQVTDERGRCLHRTGSHRYTPPEGLARTVRAAHQTCRFPGCRREARGCDLDHRLEYPAGPTCRCNLQPMCRAHHNLKTHGRWRVELTDPLDPLGPLSWIGPAGRICTAHPEEPRFGFGAPGSDPPY